MKILLFTLLLAGNLLGQDVFHIQVKGTGRPLILIPGLSSSGETWDTTVARYKDRFECHVLTVSGFAGVTPADPGPDDLLRTIREQLANYIREHKLAKPTVIGHSLGGTIAMDLASSYPDLIGKLVIVDSYPFTMGLDPSMTPAKAKEISAQIRSGFASMSKEAYLKSADSGANTNNMTKDPANQKLLIQWARTSDQQTVAQALAEMLGGDWRDDVGRITAPSLVLAAWQGSESYGATHEVVDRNLHAQYAKLKGVNIYINDKARHFIMWDDPDWMFAHLDRFLGAK